MHSLIAQTLDLKPSQVAAALELLDDGNTVPFIARYRKEATGSLDEEQLRAIQAEAIRLRALQARRETVLKTIAEQDKLTPELEAKIRAAATLTELEDLYQPYKPKRRTRAALARKRGLQPLADLILRQARPAESMEALAQPYLSEEIPDAEAAWSGARDIVAETISDHAEVRQRTRQKALEWAVIQAEKIPAAADPKKVYADYYEFETRVNRLRPHQILALNRGEREGVLRIHVEVPERDWRDAIQRHFRPDLGSPLRAQLLEAIEDAAKRLLLPAITRDVRRALTEQAESQAIRVFADNLRALLLQPPLSGHTVLGLDPGFRTGCKAAVVDPTGKVLDTGVIYVGRDDRRAFASLRRWVQQHGVTLIAIGNGTASRETERLVAAFLRTLEGEAPRYLIVNEAGASVYSASPLARAELPGLDVSLRGAVSIARRVLDPLAELVKIDPKSIGVGMYQHDVNQKALTEALHAVVESVVNQVGVDLNTASPALLTYVSGIGPKLAEKIVAYRDGHGPFRERGDLRKVDGLGPKAFQQSAGFLRIRGGTNPLDASAIHPESYPVAEGLLSLAGISPRTPPQERAAPLEALRQRYSLPQLADELGCGLPTLADIFRQLLRPGRDPREDVPPPVLRSDVLSMDDLQPGMALKGTVRNVVDFGAFVDIGVKRDGLLHRSRIPRGTRLRVGQVIEVRIAEVDRERQRISLAWGRDDGR